MDAALVVDLIRETCLMVLKVSAPVLIVGFVVGLGVSLLQALTQVQEATISFVPKLAAILFAFFISFQFMITNLIQFTHFLFDKISTP